MPPFGWESRARFHMSHSPDLLEGGAPLKLAVRIAGRDRLVAPLLQSRSVLVQDPYGERGESRASFFHIPGGVGGVVDTSGWGPGPHSVHLEVPDADMEFGFEAYVMDGDKQEQLHLAGLDILKEMPLPMSGRAFMGLLDDAVRMVGVGPGWDPDGVALRIRRPRTGLDGPFAEAVAIHRAPEGTHWAIRTLLGMAYDHCFFGGTVDVTLDSDRRHHALEIAAKPKPDVGSLVRSFGTKPSTRPPLRALRGLGIDIELADGPFALRARFDDQVGLDAGRRSGPGLPPTGAEQVHLGVEREAVRFRHRGT